MKTGKVMNVMYYIDESNGGHMPSVELNIIYKNIFGIEKLINGYKYGYPCEDIKPGDIVAFKFDEFYTRRFKALAKIKNKPTINKTENTIKVNFNNNP